jgi:hypothetical protein|tara:strand:+ start:86 stop:289 length:204 start_codon:yes stop_codon:yes gene_type:complete
VNYFYNGFERLRFLKIIFMKKAGKWLLLLHLFMFKRDPPSFFKQEKEVVDASRDLDMLNLPSLTPTL